MNIPAPWMTYATGSPHPCMQLPQDHEPWDHRFMDTPSPAPKARCVGWRLEKQTKPSFFENTKPQNNVHSFETDEAWVCFRVLFDFNFNFALLLFLRFLHADAGVDASREAWQSGQMTR